MKIESVRVKEGIPVAPNTYVAKGLFLACCCLPEEDIDICLPDTELIRIPAIVSQINKLSDDVLELKIKPNEPFKYRPGQYVTLWRDEHTGRSYSLASLPATDDTLNFHIKRVPNGVFSSWAHQQLRSGDTLFVQGPSGDCFYTQGKPEQNLLLVGTGTGLAPLYGIIRDALANGHKGSIHLFHGALDMSGLYLQDQLSTLAQQHDELVYHPCVLKSGHDMPENVVEGDISKIVAEIIPEPTSWKTFLCGDQTHAVGLVNR